VLRKSPPSTTPAVNSHGHVAAVKKDFGILAEKELKKRKREQLQEMKKHLEGMGGEEGGWAGWVGQLCSDSSLPQTIYLKLQWRRR
jgi:hypothetical protein